MEQPPIGLVAKDLESTYLVFLRGFMDQGLNVTTALSCDLGGGAAKRLECTRLIEEYPVMNFCSQARCLEGERALAPLPNVRRPGQLAGGNKAKPRRATNELKRTWRGGA